MEVLLSEQMFVHYRPMELSESCLESRLAELEAYFGFRIVI